MRESAFIGRQHEQKLLAEIGSRKESAILIVHGRRRAGKTRLIEHCYGSRNLIKIEGIEGKDKHYQIQSFLEQLATHFREPLLKEIRHSSWREPLRELAKRTETGEVTIFLEELQWLASYKVELIAELKFAWDNSFSKNSRLILVLCGSSPSFMIGKVVNSKSLHNRSLYEIPLKPFSVGETQQFLGRRCSTAQALEAVLMVGGIPEYLRYLRGDQSLYLAFCKNTFKPGAFFSKEIERIFVSSLARDARYLELIELIARYRVTSRLTLLKRIKASPGGNISRLLKDLELSQLIYRICSFKARANSKLLRYEIADPYSRLYYRFIEPKIKLIDSGAFEASPSKGLLLSDYYQALGYSFEHYCRAYPHLIAKAVGFNDVEYSVGSWLERGNKSGVQVDLVYDRADRVLSLCELKYSQNMIDQSVIREFSAKLSRLKLDPRKRLQSILVAPHGATDAVRNAGVFDRILTIDDLFGG